MTVPTSAALPLDTDTFAALLGVKANTVRVRLCRTGSYFGVRPAKAANGRLLWPADGPSRLLTEAGDAA